MSLGENNLRAQALGARFRVIIKRVKLWPPSTTCGVAWAAECNAGLTMRFERAFEVAPGDVVAFIGAGGKTSLMVELGIRTGRKPAGAYWRPPPPGFQPISSTSSLVHHGRSPPRPRRNLSRRLPSTNLFLLARADSGRLSVYGPPLEWTRQLLDSVDSDVLLVEADDAARSCPSKRHMPG